MVNLQDQLLSNPFYQAYLQYHLGWSVKKNKKTTKWPHTFAHGKSLFINGSEILNSLHSEYRTLLIGEPAIAFCSNGLSYCKIVQRLDLVYWLYLFWNLSPIFFTIHWDLCFLKFPHNYAPGFTNFLLFSVLYSFAIHWFRVKRKYPRRISALIPSREARTPTDGNWHILIILVMIHLQACRILSATVTTIV